MKEFFDILRIYWFVISGIILFIFTLGVTWQKAQTSMNGVKKLFEVVDEIVGFKEAQLVHNEVLKDQAKMIADKLADHDKEDDTKFAGLMLRIDQIYEMLLGMKK